MNSSSQPTVPAVALDAQRILGDPACGAWPLRLTKRGQTQPLLLPKPKARTPRRRPDRRDQFGIAAFNKPNPGIDLSARFPLRRALRPSASISRAIRARLRCSPMMRKVTAYQVW